MSVGKAAQRAAARECTHIQPIGVDGIGHGIPRVPSSFARSLGLSTFPTQVPRVHCSHPRPSPNHLASLPALALPSVLQIHSMSTSRQSPVIVITGTPGTGKTTHAELLAQESPIPLKHINVGDLVKEKGFHESYDEDWQSYTIDEDKVRRPTPAAHTHTALINTARYRSSSMSSSRSLPPAASSSTGTPAISSQSDGRIS